MFLEQNDLHSKIRESDLMKITGGDLAIALHAMSFAVGVMRSYLSEKYDTERIFEATGDLREGMLVSMGVDLAVYEIVSIAQPNIDLTDRRERRNAAIEYLRQVRDSDLPTGWPLRAVVPDQDEDGVTSSGPVAYGGRPPRNNYF